MPLSPGARLGAYEILSAIGAGGMGEVYRAADRRLKRQVAIKILPPLFAADAERLSRLQREAEVLAVLNHPNIAAIYGLEESDGVKALVMELVEGEDLAERLNRGPIPIDEVLPIARQLAEGLEAAHDAGVIHRDLKPANIKLRPDGAVKVLDFGLARPAAGDGTASGSRGANHLANSPTLTSPAALTAAGVILGTAAYMSPEQVRGHFVDRRSDIWAFGVVAFEMITGRRLFDEATISDTLASVLRTQPDWTRLPSSVPSRLRELLRSCLEKDPKRRLQAIGDARVQIERILAGETEGAGAKAAPVPMWQRILPWAAAAAFGAATVVLSVLRISHAPAAAPLRVNAMLDPGLSLATAGQPAVAISPDGTQLAFVAQRARTGPAMIYVRQLRELESTPLPGTEGAICPFFSTDGKSIGFVVDKRLKRSAVTGGSAIDIAAAPLCRGAAWGDDDSIVFVPLRDTSLVRVSAPDGPATQVGALAEGEATQRWPQVLPGSRTVLFTSSRVANAGYNDASVIAHSMHSGDRKTILTGGFHARYLASGHLVYVHRGTLFARPFDVSRLEITGPAVAVQEGVMSDTNTGSAQFAVSDNGTLVYVPGPSAAEGVDIQWLDRNGTASPLRPARSNWWNVRFAPDRRRLALQITDLTDDIWTYDWARNALTRVTNNAGANTFPVWTSDGRRLVFASTRESKSPNLYWQGADETDGAKRLTTSGNAQRPSSWDSRGFLFYDELNARTKLDLMMLPIDGDEVSGWKPGEPTVILNGDSNESHPMVSPDGRWLAYVSDESGRDEVYVRPFSRPGGRTPISTEGGRSPVWSPTSGEILYGTASRGQGQVMIAAYSIEGGAFVVAKSRVWAGASYQFRGPNRMFDLYPDGTRIALGPVIQPDDRFSRDYVTFVFNFFTELRRGVTQQSP